MCFFWLYFTVLYVDDGYIDFDEYFHVMQTKMTEENIETEKLMESFKLLDVDNDGHITREEFAQALSVTGSKLTKKQIDDLVDRADSNKDGKIDFNGRILCTCNRKIQRSNFRSKR
jgi:Ca2+-binding EF-hand superfamily protein